MDATGLLREFCDAVERHDGRRFADYREVANTGPGFADMNFALERIVKILRRQGDALKARPEAVRHLA